MRWVDALKQWNGQNPDGHWCVPKKGTADYDKVKAIMAKSAPGEIATGKKVLKASDSGAIQANRDKVLGEWAKGIQAKGDEMRAKYAEWKAKKAPAPAPAPAKKAEEPKKTTFPLVSKEQYKIHVKLLSAVFAGKKAMVKDRPLQAELADAFFNTGSMGGMKTHSQAFINGIVGIYNDTTKRKSRYSNPPTKLEWLDWFNASKTDQTDGIDYTKSDNYRYGGLEKYFNIYPDATGKAREFHNKEYGYFFGFSDE